MIKKKNQSSAHLKKEEKNSKIRPGRSGRAPGEPAYTERYQNDPEWDGCAEHMSVPVQDGYGMTGHQGPDYYDTEADMQNDPVSGGDGEKRRPGSKGKKTKAVESEEKKKKREKARRRDKDIPCDTAVPEEDTETENINKGSGKKSGKNRRFRKFRITLITTICVLLLIFAGIAAGGYYVTEKTDIFPNIYVDGVFIGGMNTEQAVKELENNGWDEKTGLAFRVKLPGGVSFKLDRCSAGAVFTKEAAAKAAFRYGHFGNIFENLLRYVENLISPVDMSDEYLSLNEKYIRETAQKGIEKFEIKTADRGYTIDNRKEVLRMMKGAGQMKIDIDRLCDQIGQCLENNLSVLEYRNIDSELEKPDFGSLYDELAVEPEDAYYQDDFSVVDEVVGCSFDAAEAEKIWDSAEPAEIVEIPLSIHLPEKTGEYLRSLIYRDKLGSMTTSFAGSIDARVNNINLAATKIDGIVLMPGDVFSYNGTVGQRTEEAGFQPAAAYADGEIVEEVGGGICQVSSTLYGAAMYSMLETVSRTNHYFKVGYADWGMDATVSWPKPDFKFKNNREFPVQIRAICNPDTEELTVEIWGTNLDGTYVKEITHSRLCVYDEEYTEENVVIGFGVSAYRKVYDRDGNFLYEIEEPYGIYYKNKEDI